MMKRMLALLLCALLPLTAANATILPPEGVDEGFYSWTGIECTPAVILCESLSVLDARGDQGGKVVETRHEHHPRHRELGRLCPHLLF